MFTTSITEWLGFAEPEAIRHLLSGVHAADSDEESIQEAINTFINGEGSVEVEVEREVFRVDEDGNPTEIPIRRILIKAPRQE